MSRISNRGGLLELTCRRGADLRLDPITLTEAGGAVDLTGCALRAAAWFGGVELTFETAVTLPNGFSVVLRAADTATSLPVLKGEWSLECEWPDGRVDELLYGPIEITGKKPS